jgi:hypothetical protein
VPVLRHPGTGEVINVPEGEVGHAVIQGYQPVSLQEAAQTTAAAAPSDQSGIVGGINSLATGALSGLTLGASDVALAGLLDPGQLERLSSARSQHGTLGTAGQIAGAIAPSLLGAAPGSLLARSPAGIASRIGSGLADLGEGASTVARIGAHVASGAAEGALQNAGAYVADVALGDRDLSADAFVGAMGQGALWGGAGSGALALSGEALAKARGLLGGAPRDLPARKLFPSQEVTPQAVEEAHAAASKELGAALDDGDTLMQRAQQTIVDQRNLALATDPAFAQRAAELSATPTHDVELEGLLGNLKAPQVSPEGASLGRFDPELETLLHGLDVPDVGEIGGRIDKRPPIDTKVIGGPSPANPANAMNDALDARARELNSTRVGKRKIDNANTPSTSAGPLSDTEGEAFKKAFGHAMSRQQFDSAMYYSKGGDEVINGALRAGKNLEGADARALAQLDSMMRMPEAGIPRDTTLYRGLSGKWAKERFSELKPGDVYDDPAFTSTSHDANSKVRNEDVVINIATPAGSAGAPIPSKFSSEVETLLPRGSRFRVDSNEMKPQLPTATRWRGAKSHVVHGDKSITITFENGTSHTYPPYREVHVTLLPGEFTPDLLVKRGSVTLESPIDKLSRRQLSEHQDLLSAKFDELTSGTPEYEQASKRWDRAVKRLIDMEDGKIADVPDYVDEKPPSPEAPTSRPDGGHGGDLLSQLQGTKSALDQGQELGAMGGMRPRARGPDPVEAELAARNPTVAKLRAAVGELREARSDLQGLLNRTDPREYAARLRREGPGWRESVPAGEGNALGARGRQIEWHGSELERNSAEFRINNKVKPEERVAAGQAVDEMMSRRAMTPDERIADALKQRPDNVAADIDEASRVIGRYESAHAGLAELAQALGIQVPSGAAARAEGFRAAQSHAEQATQQATALGADQLTKASGHAMLGGETPVARAAADKTVRDPTIGRQVREEFARGDKTVREPGLRDEIGAKHAANLAGASTGTTSRSGHLADAGTIYEALRMMGVPLPDPHDIPVIGPLLSVYLRARVIGKTFGRFGGRIAETAETTIARKAAETKQRVFAAVDGILHGSSKAATAASPAAGGAAAILAHRLFDGSHPGSIGKVDRDTKDIAELYQRRSAELADAAQPGAIRQAVQARIRAADPTIVNAIADGFERQVQFLLDKMPKPLEAPGILPGSTAYTPNRGEMTKFARYVQAATDPATVLEQVASGGVVTPQAAEALKVVYPSLFAAAQKRLLEQASDVDHPVPYGRREQASLLFDVPLDSTMTPSYAAWAQQGYAPPQPPPSASGATLRAPTTIAKMTQGARP